LSANQVLAAALKGELNNMFLAIGSGDLSWDTARPAPSKTDTSLFAEYYRRPIDSVTHITEITGYNENIGAADEIESSLFEDIDPSLLIGRLVEIIGDAGNPVPIGETRTITAVTDSVPFIITVDSPFTSTPTTTTKFRIGYVSNIPTGVVDIETTFPAEDGNAFGTIREEAIFGGDATDLLNSGIMLNVIRHEPLSKQTGTSLTRVVRIRLEMN
jgi:hypothetical protein